MSQDIETTQAAQPQGMPPGGLIGQTVGGKYELRGFIGATPLGDRYQAVDDAQTPVSVLACRLTLVAGQDSHFQTAVSALTHKNIACPIALVPSENGQPAFVVSEFVDGLGLRELLKRKVDAGQPGFDPRSANNIVHGIAAALSHAHPDTPHGAIGLDSVIINNAGRVKVLDFGLGPSIAAAVSRGALPAEAAPAVAPECRAGAGLTPTCDVYSLGRLLYALLVGRPLIAGGPRPSEVKGLVREVDELVARCVTDTPGSRIQTPAGVSETLATLLRASTQQSGQHALGQLSGQSSGRTSLAKDLGHQASQSTRLPSSAGVSAHDRFLVSKGDLDYGPYDVDELREQIASHQVVPGHVLINSDTGARLPVESHAVFGPLVVEAQRQFDEKRRAAAEVSLSKGQRRRGFVLYSFIAIAFTAIGLTVYLLVGGAKKPGATPEQSAGGLRALAAGDVEAGFSFPDPPKRRTRGKRRKSGGASPASGGQTSDTMDFGAGGPDEAEPLDPSYITSIIRKKTGRLAGCMSRNGARSASVKYTIGTAGKVTKVTVSQAPAAAASCVKKVILGLKFKTNATKTHSTFSMNF